MNLDELDQEVRGLYINDDEAGIADQDIPAELARYILPDDSDGFGGEVAEASFVGGGGKKAKVNQNIDAAVHAYVNRFLKTATVEQAKYGIPVSINLAQGLVESRSGESFLAKKANNHFGIKCMSKRCGKGKHCTKRKDDTPNDRFVNFGTPWQSWRAHSILLSGSKRYRSLFKTRDYRQWAQGLKKCGYATAPAYDRVLIGIIQRYNLNQYDK